MNKPNSAGIALLSVFGSMKDKKRFMDNWLVIREVVKKLRQVIKNSDKKVCV